MNFLVVAGNGATTQINDTIDKVDVVLTATKTVGEGGEIVYTATLVDKNGAPVTKVLVRVRGSRDRSGMINVSACRNA